MERIVTEEEESHVIYIWFFDLIMWWEAKVRSGSTKYPFKEEIDHSKIPQLLSGKLAQLKTHFENNMPGAQSKLIK